MENHLKIAYNQPNIFSFENKIFPHLINTKIEYESLNKKFVHISRVEEELNYLNSTSTDLIYAFDYKKKLDNFCKLIFKFCTENLKYVELMQGNKKVSKLYKNLISLYQIDNKIEREFQEFDS